MKLKYIIINRIDGHMLYTDSIISETFNFRVNYLKDYNIGLNKLIL